MAQFTVYRGQIENYNADISEKGAFTCSIGERFLVLERVSDHPRVPDGSLDDGKARKPPSQRFLRYSSFTQGAGHVSKKIFTEIPQSELLTRIQFIRNTWAEPEVIKKTIRQTVCAAPNRDASLCDIRDSIETNLESAPLCTPKIMECDGITLRDYLITDFSGKDNQQFDKSYGYNRTPYKYKSTPRRLASINSECALKDFSTTLYLPENVNWVSFLTRFLMIRDGLLDAESKEAAGSMKIMPLKYGKMKYPVSRLGQNMGYVEYRVRLQNHPQICEP